MLFLFILGCALFLWPLHSKIALCGDRFLRWLTGFFLLPLAICFWMLRAVWAVPPANVTCFPVRNLTYREPGYLLKISKKKCVRRQKRATKFMIAAASISKQWLIMKWSTQPALGNEGINRRANICIQGACWVVCSEKSHRVPYLVTIIPLTVHFFSYSYFFQNIKAILKRQEVRSGSQVSKQRRKKNDH